MDLFWYARDFRGSPQYLNGLFKTKEEILKELRGHGKTKVYHVLSFGGGTQSAYLLEQHLRGHIHYDYIVFSDTGAEPQFIHEQVKFWQDRQKRFGNTTPFIITHHNRMRYGLEEMLFRYLFTNYQRFQMPVYFSKVDEKTGQVVEGGMMPRQCTVDFKIVPVKQTIRKQIMQEHGFHPNQKFPDHVAVVIDIGFSFDEMRRIKQYQSPQFKYMYLAYPLVEEGITTEEALQFLKDNDLPLKRSRCYFCPFNCDDRNTGMTWEEIIKTEPLSFLKACYFDEQLRITQRSGQKIMKSIPFFHYSRKPLKEVYKAEYDRLLSIYRTPLSQWIAKWKNYIKGKYEV